MGSLIEGCACKKHLCHNSIDETSRKYDKDLNLLQNKENKEDTSSEYSSEENDNVGELGIDALHSKTRVETSIPKDIVEFKVSTNSLVKGHFTNPWDFYFDEEDLGSGSYGTVKKVSLIEAPEVIRAMKIIPKSNVLEGNNLLDEINILKKLEHPNIMKVYEYFDDSINIYIVTELCDQGNLLEKMEKLGSLNQLVVKFLMEQIFNAVSYLHSNQVFHGDIKLENIMLYRTSSREGGRRFTGINRELNTNKKLENEVANSLKDKKKFNRRSMVYVENLTDFEVKLIDFGCSKYLKKKKKNKLSGIVGTSIYCSPEIIDNAYDEMSDEWACGVLMYILLSGQPPFPGNDEDEIFENVKKGHIDFSLKNFNYVSDNCKDLICKLLEQNKKKRIKACDALKHPFFFEDFNPMKALTFNTDLTALNNLLNIEKFPSKLHEVVTAYLCFNFIDKEDEKKLRELFRYIDRDNRTKINIVDFKRAFKDADILVSTKQLKNIMNILDSDGNTTIEYQEFLRAMCDKKKLYCEKNLRSVFAVIDKNKKGFINESDIFRFVFGKQNYHRDSIKRILAQMGFKKNSTFNFEQFSDLIKMTNADFEDKKINKDEKEEQKEAEYDSAKENIYMTDLHSTVSSKKRNDENYILNKNEDEEITPEMMKSLRMSVLLEHNSGRRKSYI